MIDQAPCETLYVLNSHSEKWITTSNRHTLVNRNTLRVNNLVKSSGERDSHATGTGKRQTERGFLSLPKFVLACERAATPELGDD